MYHEKDLKSRWKVNIKKKTTTKYKEYVYFKTLSKHLPYSHYGYLFTIILHLYKVAYKNVEAHRDASGTQRM